MVAQQIRPVTIKRRYIELSLIGEGGMGAVYRVLDRLTDSQVAMKKVIAPPQALLLSSLRHPNIISVLDYGFEQDAPYFTMNLLEQPTTFTLAAKQQSLTGQIN